MTGLLLAFLFSASSTNLTGVITFDREGMPFHYMTDSSGVSWRLDKPLNDVTLKFGDSVIVTGEPEESVKHRLLNVRAQVVGKGTVPAPIELSVGDIFASVLPYGKSPFYAARIVTEGMLRDINRRQSSTQLLVGEGDRNIQLEMPWPLETALPAELVLGATLRVTGNLVYTSIENFEEGVFGRVENVELMPMGDDDIKVVKRAPFFTAARLVNLLCGVLAITFIVGLWAVSLRRMVARRTAELGESIRERETSRIEADAVRRERLRLAADLHDGFQQYLAGAMFRLKAAMNYLPKDALSSREQLKKVQEALQHTQSGLRSTLWAMNEESEGPESLLALFSFAVRRMPHWEGRVRIDCEGEERRIARKSAATLLLIMQEAVGNALKHGGAENVKVRLAFGTDRFTMQVIDDGCGFDIDENRGAGHYGMASMERRTVELGGSMHLWSKKRLGSKLIFDIPYK